MLVLSVGSHLFRNIADHTSTRLAANFFVDLSYAQIGGFSQLRKRPMSTAVFSADRADSVRP